jgi:hypothetical protein
MPRRTMMSLKKRRKRARRLSVRDSIRYRRPDCLQSKSLVLGRENFASSLAGVGLVCLVA